MGCSSIRNIPAKYYTILPYKRKNSPTSDCFFHVSNIALLFRIGCSTSITTLWNEVIHLEMQEHVGSRVVARLSSKRKTSYSLMKRLTDIVISFSLLLLMVPLLLFISYRLDKKEGRPILAKERCAGKGEDIFIMYRFRTMTNPSMVIRALPLSPKQGIFTSRSNPRCILTSTGIWLKHYHLHLLPQLWNVLKGEMSLVGPAPETIEAPSYNYKRLTVKPGMTGYAQVFGNRGSSAQFRMNADQYYIENCSYKLDMMLLFQTIKKLFKKKS